MNTPKRDELPDEKCSICGFTGDAADLVGHLREQHNGIANAVPVDKDLHSCACQFKGEKCVDPCCYHTDLEKRHAQLQKDFDVLHKDYATAVNGKKGLDLYGQPLPSPTSEFVAALKFYAEQSAKRKTSVMKIVHFSVNNDPDTWEEIDDGAVARAALAAHGGKV